MEKLGIEDLPSFLLERGIDPETGDPIRGDDDTGDEGEPAANGARRGRTQADIIREMKQAETRGEDRAAARYEGALLAYAAEAALRGAGWKGSDLGLMLRLVDHRAMSIEFDDANDPIVYGLDEQVEAIRREFPDRFHGQEPERETRRPRRRAGAREIDGGDRGRPKPRQTGWLQQLDQRIANGQ